MPSQVPVIAENPLSGGWSCITKYKMRGNVVEAKQKYDVTNQINAIVKLINSRKRKRRKPDA